MGRRSRPASGGAGSSARRSPGRPRTSSSSTSPRTTPDATARALLVAALRRFRGVGLLVSHDRALVEALAARTLRLHGGEARLWPLRYGAAREAWEAERRAAWDRRASAQAEGRSARARLARARQVRAEADAARPAGRGRDPNDGDSRAMGAKTVKGWAEARLGREVTATPGRRRSAPQGLIPDAPPDVASLGASVFVGFERAPRPVLLLASRRGPSAPATASSCATSRSRSGARAACASPGRTGPGRRRSSRRSSPGRRSREWLFHLPQELAPGEGAARAPGGARRALDPVTRGRVLALVAALGTDPARLLASLEFRRRARPASSSSPSGSAEHAWALRPRRADEPPRPPHRRAARGGAPRLPRARSSS